MFAKLNIVEGRNPHYGVNGILTHYHLRYDPYVGLGICFIRILPCYFIECRYAMFLPLDPSISPNDRP